MRFFFQIFFMLLPVQLFSQAEPLSTTPIVDSTSNDSLQVELTTDEYADEKNGLRSMVLPGWGQIRNDQPLKAGLFFGATVAGVYTTLQYSDEFSAYDNAYSIRLQTFNDPEDEFPQLSLDELHEFRRSARSEKDIATGATAYVYLVNVFDAAAQYKIQREDPNKHSATKAAYYSAILPGLGQAYNKKYWKIPIVYAALGTSAYIAINNRDYHRDYRTELEYRSVDETTGFRTALTTENLEDQLEYWRKWRDIAYVATGAVYLLNILDATVDAHLKDYNVDEDLAFRPSPVVDQINGQFYYGINISFDLAKQSK